MPSPAMLHLRGGRSSISKTVYPDLAEFWSDTAAAYRKAIRHLADAGCTYLQLDDVSFSYLCDPKIQETARKNGDDPATVDDRQIQELGIQLTAATRAALQARQGGG